jgi:hypothetical protein
MTQTKRWFNIKQREPIVNPASYIHIVGYRPSSINLRSTRDDQQHAANHLREIFPTHLVRISIYIFVSCQANWRLTAQKVQAKKNALERISSRWPCLPDSRYGEREIHCL